MASGPQQNIPGVLCFGNLVRDIAVGPVGEPGWGRSTWVDFISEGIGGNGANTSYAIAKLGTPTRLVSWAGDDEAGDRVLATLKSVDVDTSFVRRSKLPTATTVALVRPDGARALLHRLGASSEAFMEPVELTPALVEGCAWFHLANVFALPHLRMHAADAVARAKQSGLRVSIDTGWDARGQWMNVLAGCLSHADLLFVNDDEARELSGIADPVKSADALLNCGVGTVVVKLGAAGCLVRSAAAAIQSPGFKVEVIDTTGAGDCFVGAFLAATQRGLALEEAARFANAAGAMSVQCAGCTRGLLPYAETLAWIEKH